MTSFHNKNDIIVHSWYMMWPSNLGVLVLRPQASDVDDVWKLATLSPPSWQDVGLPTHASLQLNLCTQTSFSCLVLSAWSKDYCITRVSLYTCTYITQCSCRNLHIVIYHINGLFDFHSSIPQSGEQEWDNCRPLWWGQLHCQQSVSLLHRGWMVREQHSFLRNQIHVCVKIVCLSLALSYSEPVSLAVT